MPSLLYANYNNDNIFCRIDWNFSFDRFNQFYFLCNSTYFTHLVCFVTIRRRIRFTGVGSDADWSTKQSVPGIWSSLNAWITEMPSNIELRLDLKQHIFSLQTNVTAFVFSAFSHSRWLFTLRTLKGQELFRCPITQIIYNLLWRVSRLESSKKKGGRSSASSRHLGSLSSNWQIFFQLSMMFFHVWLKKCLNGTVLLTHS